MNKKGSWKYILVFGIVLFLIIGVIAQETSVIQTVSDLSNETQQYIKDFVAKENIKEDQINSITQVDLNNPPKEIKIDKIDEKTNVGVYEVNYTDEADKQKKMFMVTYASLTAVAPPEISSGTSVTYLNFGETDLTRGSQYLKTATGVRSSEEKGYVMMDSGSITGLSINVEVVSFSSEGKIDVVVLKNGKEVGIRNSIDVSSVGVKKDYDIQSKDMIKFEAGDVVSVYLQSDGNIQWRNAINLVKLEVEKA